MEQGLAVALQERDQAHADFRRVSGELEAVQAGMQTAQAALAAEHAVLVTERQARMMAESRALSAEDHEKFALWRHLAATDRLLELRDGGIKPKVRFGYGKPPHPQLQALFSQQAGKYRQVLESFLPLLPDVVTIPPHATEDPAEPNWINPALPAFDALALYGLIATTRPRRFIEIGSGFSTKFARRAIRDGKLATPIISIAPEPRAEIDVICDEVVRSKLEDAPLDLFKAVTRDDFIFFGSSHRTFQNSDVAVFFTEVLPVLPKGVLVGIHDIFWPVDYPPAWLNRYFSEQYMLACWLLAGDRLEVVLPVHYCENQPELMRIMGPYWSHPSLAGASHVGAAFFFRVK